jgi:L-lactate dehydrogenase complex protein LldG
MTSRELILNRARDALRDQPDPPSIPRDYHGAGASGLDSADVVARFEARVREYGALVSHATPATVAATLGRIAREHDAACLVRPDGLHLLIPGLPLVIDAGLSADELDAVDGVITGCAAAIAETGTIVLDGGPRCGRRAISLIPDLHLCLVEAGQIVPGVPDAVALIEERGLTTDPLTLISGPSATSDIGFERVEGVHGPRRLEIVVVTGDSSDAEAAP